MIERDSCPCCDWVDIASDVHRSLMLKAAEFMVISLAASADLPHQEKEKLVKSLAKRSSRLMYDQIQERHAASTN